MKKTRKRLVDRSRTNPPAEIFVKGVGYDTWNTPYCRAHLRNKRGYVYLQWRDGDRVRSLYLGKAPRKSPTGSSQLELDQAGAGRARSGARRTPKVGQKRKGNRTLRRR